MKTKLLTILILFLYILTYSQTLNPIPNSINAQKKDVSKSYFEINNNFKINENYGSKQLNSQLEFASIYKTEEEFEDLKTEGLLILMFFTLITVVMIIIKAIQLKKISLENSINWIGICKQDYYFLLGYSFITSVFNLAFYIYKFSQYGLYNLITIYITHLPLLIISLNIFKKNTINKKYIYLIIILMIIDIYVKMAVNLIIDQYRVNIISRLVVPNASYLLLFISIRLIYNFKNLEKSSNHIEI